MEETTSDKTYDLVVLGAGICGLNALAVGSQYLGSTDRVLLIDRRRRVGGMWVDTYDYVRLHQPHPFFTAGDIKWTLGADRSHLATKHEVLDHFAHCVEVVRGRVRLDEWLGTEYVGHDVVDGTVRITCRSPDGTPRVVQARRFVKASGLEVEGNEPLQVSSDRVRSVSPDTCDVRRGEIADSEAPVWVVGGGKTAMDTALALISTRPGREVNMLAGRGTYFFDRDRLFPPGARRWYSGTRGLPVFSEVIQRFDGTNSHDTMRWVRDRVCISLTSDADNFLFGLISSREIAAIRSGLGTVRMDHLLDAQDADGGVDLVLRSGATQRVEPGSWLVNCTGYLRPRTPPRDFEPYTSGGGRVASFTPTSLLSWVTSLTSYFGTHLLMLDKLATVPLYQVDSDSLYRLDREAWACAMLAAYVHNMSLVFDAAPREVFTRNELDFERWFPSHRLLRSNLEFVRTHRRLRERSAAALDRVREEYGVRCGPVAEVARSA